jgi:ammonium transporter, Amt family
MSLKNGLGWIMVLSAGVAYAETELSAQASLNFMLGNMWLLIAAALVFVMHLGFACIESGFSQSKNTINVLF